LKTALASKLNENDIIMNAHQSLCFLCIAGLLLIGAHNCGCNAASIDVYADGDIDMDWSDWSFGYISREKRGIYDPTQGNKTDGMYAYCIDLPDVGAASFSSETDVPVEGTTIDFSLRLNDTIDVIDENAIAKLANIQLSLEGTTDTKATATRPVSMIELLGSQDDEETIQQFLQRKYVSFQVNASSLIAENEKNDFTGFSQINLGNCVAGSLPDEPCEAVSFCIGSLSIRVSDV